eukprot:c20866_g1_i1.p1 GENE.c20866_g1_i1~~c20866_g1_i1.p1  ORF type:complete len:408 (-),score=77.19 c20866_g1_i1:28-1224(-)
MGNSTSGTPNAIRITTDHPVYHSGDTVTGCVYLNVVEPFESNGIFFRAKGVEKVSWKESRTRSVGTGKSRRTQRTTETIQSKSQIFKTENLLHTFPGGSVPAGQYSFPFSYVLPVGLPCSFQATSLPRSGAASRIYKVKALVHVRGMMHSSHLKHTHLITIHDLHTNVQVVKQKIEDSRAIKTCCCFYKGTAFMRIQSDKNFYLPGDVAQVNCECSNQTKTKFETMNVALCRETNLRARGKVFRSCIDLNAIVVSGLDSFGEFLHDNARLIQLPFHPSNTPFWDPTTMPSTETNLIQNRYFIRVKMTVPFGSDFVLNLPVILGQAPIVTAYEQPTLEQPAGWAPQIFENIAIPAPVVSTEVPIHKNFSADTNLETPLLQDEKVLDDARASGSRIPEQK